MNRDFINFGPRKFDNNKLMITKTENALWCLLQCNTFFENVWKLTLAYFSGPVILADFEMILIKSVKGHFFGGGGGGLWSGGKASC
jgi:hypothetical protein